jgi:cytoskeletal protein CcmA (bactofilin family)
MAGSIIGEGMTIEGDFSTDDEVIVRGTVRGKLSGKDGVVVEAQGQVEADIQGGPMSIAGNVTGNIQSSDRVDLQHGSRVVGNVKAAKITISEGAHFKGSVDMDMH